MRAFVKVIAVLVIFFASASAVQYLAEIIPGTPTHRLSHQTRSSETATKLASILVSDSGEKLVTSHSWWLMLIYLPIASVVTAIAGRFLSVRPVTSLIAIGSLIAVRMAGMAFASQAYSDLLGITGNSANHSGVPIWGLFVSFSICLCLAAIATFTPGQSASRETRGN